MARYDGPDLNARMDSVHFICIRSRMMIVGT